MDFYIENDCLSLKQTLESGQCFRWRAEDEGVYRGVSGGRLLRVRQEPCGVTLLDISEEDKEYWLNYFDFSTDYNAVIKQFSADEILKKASEENRGVRILRQEPFETLISFIISQNNNIPRIIGIIERLCESFGEEKDGYFTFPSAERLAELKEEDLAPLRAGFRNRYILDAARKAAGGQVDLQSIFAMDYESGKVLLKTITGVGDKVADCVLLFAYHKTEAFPSDVWIKRIVAEHYADGLPECMGEYKGIAQQYLFEYFRNKS